MRHISTAFQARLESWRYPGNGLFVQPNGGQHRTLSCNKTNKLRQFHLSCVLACSVGEMLEQFVVKSGPKAGELLKIHIALHPVKSHFYNTLERLAHHTRLESATFANTKGLIKNASAREPESRN